VVSLLLPGVLLAQSTTNGAISGTVTDPSGAVLPGLTVNVKNVEKSFTNTTNTNAQGFSGPASTPSCSSPSSTTSGPCLSSSLFPDVVAGQIIDPSTGLPFGTGQAQLNTGTQTQRRNQFSGPHYFDTDVTIMKYTQVPHWETAKVGIGAQFFNLLNHPDFEGPVNDINSGNFGHILDTVNTPTSILGSFLGGDASPRLIQLTVKMTF
jgi:hypothetical protein